jgi:hypothetical protein
VPIAGKPSPNKVCRSSAYLTSLRTLAITHRGNPFRLAGRLEPASRLGQTAICLSTSDPIEAAHAGENEELRNIGDESARELDNSRKDTSKSAPQPFKSASRAPGAVSTADNVRYVALR